MNLEYKAPPEIKQEKIEKEIREKLKLYHQTTKEKWDKIQKTGSIFRPFGTDNFIHRKLLVNKKQCININLISS